MDEIKCTKCGSAIGMQARECDVCGRDAGFPNVRRANRQIETEALDARVASGRASAKARGVEGELSAFHLAVAQNSSAVMNRSLASLSEWVNGANPLFMSFHKQVHLLKRHPEENEWDPQREAAEAAVNPYAFQEINFAALSLDGYGMTYYGEYAVTLSELSIDERASVFEENPFVFNKHHHIIGGKPVPPGYRASWARRADLAVAKLHSGIKPQASPEDFVTVLMEDRRGESDCDFVEVHIYGDVNRKSITDVKGPQPTARPKQAILKQAKRVLEMSGANVEITR